MSTALEAIRNGVDTEQLFGTLDAIKVDRTLARFQLPARNRCRARSWNRLDEDSPIAVPSAYLDSLGLRGVSR